MIMSFRIDMKYGLLLFSIFHTALSYSSHCEPPGGMKGSRGRILDLTFSESTPYWPSSFSDYPGHNDVSYVYVYSIAPETSYIHIKQVDRMVLDLDDCLCQDLAPRSLPLMPIEHCCPTCGPCDDMGGFCALRWLPEMMPNMCDFQDHKKCRDYSCTCCIKCSSDDVCSACSQTGGECRKKCRGGEQEDPQNKCQFPGCKCCRLCKTSPECAATGGSCRAAAELCPHGTIATTQACCHGCVCCKPVCVPQPACSQNPDAYCSETPKCAQGYYSCEGLCHKPTLNHPRNICYCCIPKVVSKSPTQGGRLLLEKAKKHIGHL